MNASTIAISRSRWRFARLPMSGDGLAVIALIVLTAVACWPRLWDGTLIGQDTATFFYPMYHFLGERLRAGDIPGWNPFQFAGAPFAADPESGWMYAPAMLLFSLFSLPVAAASFLIAHLLLAGIGTYVLGRSLRLTIPGALVAAVSYEFTGLLYGRSVCCPAYLQVASWTPIILVCAEMAIRQRSWLFRGVWWGVTGFALSQVFGAWIGQGSYYALLALGSYVAYRTMFSVDGASPRVGARVLALLYHLFGMVGFGLAMAAAGLLPRLEYNALSNVAQGYQGDMAWAATLGGWTLRDMVNVLLRHGFYYVGIVTAILAIAALPFARRRHGVPYFAFLTVGCLLLAAQREIPVQTLAYTLLPRFEELHRHWPERIMVIFYVGPALLAGALISSFGPRLIPAIAALLVFVDLFVAGQWTASHLPFGGAVRVDLAAYYAPNSAATFLQTREGTVPYRYFGYDPWLFALDNNQQAYYRYQFGDPRTAALLVNNRATILGLHDVQGYNPIQLSRYVAYMRALNGGRAQDYHGAYVLPEGLASPLLDLLNARYIVVPPSAPPDRTDLQALARDHPTLFQDQSVRILENADALPRAWLVHSAQRVAAGEALPLLASRAVDPRQVALSEVNPPSLAAPDPPIGEQISVITYEPDRIRLQVHAEAPALAMLSEIYYPAWHAYVDGRRTPLFVADGILRAVPVPDGDHVIELRFESRSLQLGLVISGAAFGLFGLVIAVASAQRLRDRRVRISNRRRSHARD